jgi:hypothetical protein
MQTRRRMEAIVRQSVVVLATACLAQTGTADAADAGGSAATRYRRLPVKEYVDEMVGGWVGQATGVGVGGPTEFKSIGKIGPEMGTNFGFAAGGYGQDDIYVEMTFLQTLEKYGFDVSTRQAGIDFASSEYGLWHANGCGRNALRNGIAPPDSGHPKFNKCADDIDYQIEADFSGLIAPGLPNLVIELGEKFGRLMNYGDGLYGGQFLGSMYAEAFFEKDPEKIVRSGLACIPEKSQYHECITDVLKWWKENPEDWQKTWKLVEDKYNLNDAYRRSSCARSDRGRPGFNIDAKINGAYIVMGLLYGGGDPRKTIVIACRGGQDSDCNPANAGGVICTAIGWSNLPDRNEASLDGPQVYSATPYTFRKLLTACEKLVRQAVVRAGGRIEKDAKGEEVLVIPVQIPKPSKLEQCWEPGPIADSRFTREEMGQIEYGHIRFARRRLPGILKRLVPDWELKSSAVAEMTPYYDSHGDSGPVLVTHPPSKTEPAILTRNVAVPAGKKTILKLEVSPLQGGVDWELIVKADGQELFKKMVNDAACTDGKMAVDADLSAYAGKTIKVELLNQPNDWNCEHGLWHRIEVVSN